MKVDRADVARYLRIGAGAPDEALAARVEGLIAAAEGEVRPRRVWRRFPVKDGAVASGGLVLPIEGTLARYLGACRDVYLVCGTLGARFDAFQRRAAVQSGADALIVQAIGAAMIESWMDAMQDDIRAELAPGETILHRYSPGFGDFPLSAQRVMLSLLDAPRAAGVSLTETLLMVPSKSVSAVVGVRVVPPV